MTNDRLLVQQASLDRLLVLWPFFQWRGRGGPLFQGMGSLQILLSTSKIVGEGDNTRRVLLPVSRCSCGAFLQLGQLPKAHFRTHFRTPLNTWCRFFRGPPPTKQKTKRWYSFWLPFQTNAQTRVPSTKTSHPHETRVPKGISPCSKWLKGQIHHSCRRRQRRRR